MESEKSEVKGRKSGLKVFIDKLKAKAAEVKREVHALYIAYRDSRTPWYAKAFAALVVAYALSPIDLIPDFIPILGYLDDLILIPLGIRLAISLIPVDVMEESRNKAKEIEEEKPINWVGAVLVVLVWVIFVGVITCKLWNRSAS